MKFQNPNLFFNGCTRKSQKQYAPGSALNLGGGGVIINKVILLTEQA